MSKLDEVFPNEKLNFGKVLILGDGHKLKLSELKKLTNAKKIRKVKWTAIETEIDTFLCIALTRAFNALGTMERTVFDFYYVDGDNASSSLLRLKTDKVIESINLNAKIVKSLHNNCHTKSLIEKAMASISRAFKNHIDLCDALNTQKIQTDLIKKTNALKKVAQSYGETEFENTLVNIKAVLKSSW